MITTIFAGLLATCLFAAVPPVKESTPAVTESSESVKKNKYDELKGMAEEIKGEKLNLKEKLTLKIAAKAMNSSANKSISSASFSGDKSQTTAIILCVLLGTLGIHRFYLGYTLIGIIQLLTLGGLGIWTLIDLIRICTGALEPKDGSYS